VVLNLTFWLQLVSWILSHMTPHTLYIQLQHSSSDDPSSVPRKAPSRTKPGQNTSHEAGLWKLLCSHTRLTTGYPTLGWGIGGLGDKACWTMKILPDLELGPDYIGSNTWRLAYSEGYEAQHRFMILQTPRLRYRYLVADEDIVRVYRIQPFPTAPFGQRVVSSSWSFHSMFSILC